MSKLLSFYASDKNNNFNLIRFIAASLVLYSHCYPLFYGVNALDPLKSLVGMSIGSLAVDLFFISSGFLIAGSLYNRRSMSDFVKARILRIYPALAICLIITVFMVGPIFTTLPYSQYFTDSQTYVYFFKNLVLFFGEESILPGVFTHIPLPNTVNGSLWTLPFEVRAYALLVIVCYVFIYCETKWKTFPSDLLYLLIPIFGIVIYIANHFYNFMPIWYFGAEYARLLSMFFVGVAYFKFKNKIPMSHAIFLTSVFSLLLSSFNKDVFFVVYNISLSYIVFYLAYMPKGFIRKFNQYGDYSYGIYIYAFLVQQAAVELFPNISFLGYFFISLVITFILAYLSWQYVEKRALSLKNKPLNLFKARKASAAIKID